MWPTQEQVTRFFLQWEKGLVIDSASDTAIYTVRHGQRPNNRELSLCFATLRLISAVSQSIALPRPAHAQRANNITYKYQQIKTENGAKGLTVRHIAIGH